MAQWLILADDLTGACDTGAAFAQQGLKTVVLLAPLTVGIDTSQAGLEESQVLVLNSESRPLPEAQARLAVRACLRNFVAPGNRPFAGRVYKKIDSTLRGHPAAELQAVLAELGLNSALVTPAFPDQGRTVVDGHLLVGGERVETTVFEREMPGGDLQALFGGKRLPLDLIRQGSAAVHHVLQSDPGVWTADSQTAEDLHVLAEAGLAAGVRLFCGSAGLARALVRHLPGTAISTVQSIEPRDRVLVVAGSRHPATLRQLDAMERQGVEMISLTGRLPLVDWQAECLRAASVLGSGKPVGLCVRDMELCTGEELHLAETLGAVTAAVLERTPVERLVLTGGDTASAVCRVLGCRQLELLGEVQPGIAWGKLRGGAAPGLQVITKAGGFGSELALAALLISG